MERGDAGECHDQIVRQDVQFRHMRLQRCGQEGPTPGTPRSKLIKNGFRQAVTSVGRGRLSQPWHCTKDA